MAAIGAAMACATASHPLLHAAGSDCRGDFAIASSLKPTIHRAEQMMRIEQLTCHIGAELLDVSLRDAAHDEALFSDR